VEDVLCIALCIALFSRTVSLANVTTHGPEMRSAPLWEPTVALLAGAAVRVFIEVPSVEVGMSGLWCGRQ
jgi:hypothetical protein